MISFEIDNIRNFTSGLFAGNTFDSFLAVEADFSTACRFKIDGHLNADFVGEENMQLPEYSEGITYWKKLRPICYEIIKGKTVPRQFTIVFKMPGTYVDDFLKKTGIASDPENIDGLFLNVNFRQGRLYCTTGCSMRTFSLDKSLETEWDEYMTAFLKQF